MDKNRIRTSGTRCYWSTVLRPTLIYWAESQMSYMTKYKLFVRLRWERWFTQRSTGSFENVADFKYLITTVTTQNYRQQEINRRLNSENAGWNAFKHLFSSSLLFGNIQNYIFTFCFIPNRLTMFENRVMKGKCRPKMDGEQEVTETCILRISTTCNIHYRVR